MINKLKQHNLSFWYLNIMMILMIILPKSNDFLERFPIRVGLMALFPLIVFYEYRKGKLKFNDNKTKVLSIIYGLFILFMIPSVFISKSFITSIYTIVKFILFYITFYIVVKTDYTDKEKNIIFSTLILTTLGTIIYGILDYIFDFNLFKLSNSMYPGMRGRIRSTFFNPCYYATFLSLMFIVILYKISTLKKNKKIEIIYILICILTYLAFLFSFTRSAFLVLIVMFIMALFFFRKTILNIKTLIVTLIVILATCLLPGGRPFVLKTIDDGYLYVNNLLSFLPDINFGETSEEEVEEETEFNDLSLQHREAYAKMAKEIANDNMITGIGAGAYLQYMASPEFDEKYPDYDYNKVVPHSSLLLLFAETGILSVIMIIAFVGMLLLNMVITILKYWKNNQKAHDYAALNFIISCGFLAVSLMSENLFYDTQIYPIYLIICGLLINNMISVIKTKTAK